MAHGAIAPRLVISNRPYAFSVAFAELVIDNSKSCVFLLPLSAKSGVK